MTPLMLQYNEIKKENPGCVLFFRMGDFFELFDTDAELAAGILGITLTSRNNGDAASTPLCGFPHHAAERYIPKMVAAGHRVAICEQIEDPKLAKGIVKRAVVEIISAGTAMNEGNLVEKESNYLSALFPIGEDQLAFAFADVTTGFFTVSVSGLQAFESEFSKRMPKEVLVCAGAKIPKQIQDLISAESILITPLDCSLFEETEARRLLMGHFQVESLEIGRASCRERV